MRSGDEQDSIRREVRKEEIADELFWVIVAKFKSSDVFDFGTRLR